MCGSGVSGAETLGLSIRAGKMDLRKTEKWKWMRTVCLALVIIKLQVLLPKSNLVIIKPAQDCACLVFAVLELGSCHLQVG
jgi:hypothetical protein